MSTFADAFGWDAMTNLLTEAYKNLAIPSSDNSNFLYHLIIFHAASDPLVFAIRTSFFFAFICWFLSMASGNHSWVKKKGRNLVLENSEVYQFTSKGSKAWTPLTIVLCLASNSHIQVDKLWSILPAIYAIHFAIRDRLYWPAQEAFTHNYRAYIAAFLILLWGIRLTYNFYRKGGYGFDSEDYRWPYLGSKIPSIIWLFFNIVFICSYQNLLLVAIASPVYMTWRASVIEYTPLNWIDALATLLFIGALTLEAKADEQQWKFQEAKKAAIAKKEVLAGDFKRGFLTQGLFKYSRHPNFFGEMTIWW